MMKLHLLIALVFTLLASTSASTNDPVGDDEDVHSSRAALDEETFRRLNPGDKIPGSYIVTFPDDISKQDLLDGIKGVVNSLNGKRPTHSYSTAMKGASFDGLTDAQVAALESIDGVTVTQDQKVTVNRAPTTSGGGGCTPKIPWGVTRVNGGTVDYTGGTYTAWVIDTGIQSNHPDLNVDTARSVGFVFSKGVYSFEDEHGHGTHVAGTIAGKGVGVTGVAKGATVVAVRVLDSRGSGSTSAGVIAGIDYVAANANEGDVANMSLGGGAYTPLDNAVITAAASGIRFALAAGNESDDANNHSPARANGANIYTVSAFDVNGNFASFSNYGSSVDFAGPGVAVCSTTKGNGYATWSGTSMAAPHVAGILLWTDYGATPFTSGVVNGDPDAIPDPIMVIPQ